MATGVLLFGDSVRDPDLFHATGVAVGDPFAHVEVGGRSVTVLSLLDAPAARAAGRAGEVWTTDRFGVRDLVRGGMHPADAQHEMVRRLLAELGVDGVRVPPTFPVELADALRGSGVTVTPDREEFEGRRRRKDGPALAGIRAAQRATESAFACVRDMLAEARDGGDALVLEGETLTCERLRAGAQAVLHGAGCLADPPIVTAGPQESYGHEIGSGPVRRGDSVIVDIFPQHLASRMHADMTRTFCVGEPAAELARMHAVVHEALARSTAAIGPGVSGRAVWEAACDVVEAAGYRTQRTASPGESLAEDFFHSLGHGVGIEVHEAPALGMSGEALRPGDVVSVEPGLYRAAVGGVRLEDLVLVTDEGHEVLTSFPYELAVR